MTKTTYSEVCDCCGHIKNARAIPLSKWLVGTLRILVENWDQWKVTTAKDTKTNSQYCTIQKLKYFGLAIKDAEKNGWKPTRKWVEFIDWETWAMNAVIVMEDESLPLSHPARKEYKGKWPKMVYYWQVDKERYKQRQEYIDEKYRTDTWLFDQYDWNVELMSE